MFACSCIALASFFKTSLLCCHIYSVMFIYFNFKNEFLKDKIKYFIKIHQQDRTSSKYNVCIFINFNTHNVLGHKTKNISKVFGNYSKFSIYCSEDFAKMKARIKFNKVSSLEN